jgi:hypothetical protein
VGRGRGLKLKLKLGQEENSIPQEGWAHSVGIAQQAILRISISECTDGISFPLELY